MIQNLRPGLPFSLVSCLFLFFSMIISLASLANKINKSPILKRTVVLNDIIQRLEVWGNVEIVLTPDLSDSISVEGLTTDINMVGIKLKHGKLSVRAKWISPTGTTKIIVPAAMLNTVEVYGNAVISSSGELSTAKLKVFLDGEAQVKIKSRGEVDVQASDGYYLTKEKSSSATSARAKVLTRADDYYWGGVQTAVE